jgi:hypothetical protein
MDLSGEGLLWYARPQLFFHCTVAPTGRLHDTGRHRQLALVFFSTFEPINLPIDSVMKREGVPMFYHSASSTNLPSLYLCRAENVLGRVPMMQCRSALWLEIARPPCPIDLATAMELLPIPARGGATEVGCTSSTSGCGGMGGASHGMSLWQKLSRGARNERGMLDDGQRRR